MKKRIISLTLTVFLGAGAGHIYLKKFLKAALLIGANFALAVSLVIRVMRDPAFEGMGAMEAVGEFIAAYSHKMAWHDAAIAAILAYAIVDVWLLSAYEKKDGSVG
ncbi:MAG: hypothetical protein QME32_04850 [Endomicrobiia bacterium]|nr:hypothetical protein [Endomicrobiia bacterium]